MWQDRSGQRPNFITNCLLLGNMLRMSKIMDIGNEKRWGRCRNWKKKACIEATCVCDTTCNGIEATRTSYVSGVTKTFATRLCLPKIELVLVVHVCHHSLTLNHHVFVRAHLATSPTSPLLGDR